MTPQSPPRTGTRLRIERLELDLRGIAPGTAKATAQLLGPALGAALHGALAADTLSARPADRLDAGRITSPASPEAGQLAATIAGHIAGTLRRGRS